LVRVSGTRPGCGSKSVELEIAERLAAAARGEKLGARQIDLGTEGPAFRYSCSSAA